MRKEENLEPVPPQKDGPLDAAISRRGFLRQAGLLAAGGGVMTGLGLLASPGCAGIEHAGLLDGRRADPGRVAQRSGGCARSSHCAWHH